MAIKFHPEPGTILICDFRNMEVPEMQKKRPVIVVSPRFRNRDKICTVVPLSTTPPRPVQAYHYKLFTDPPLPHPYNSEWHWVKADMVYAMSFSRLDLPFLGKDDFGNRQYDVRTVDPTDFAGIRSALLAGLGLIDS